MKVEVQFISSKVETTSCHQVKFSLLDTDGSYDSKQLPSLLVSNYVSSIKLCLHRTSSTGTALDEEEQLGERQHKV